MKPFLSVVNRNRLGMLKVAALTQGRQIPSARFRVSQYCKPLLDRGIDVQELPATYGAYPPISTRRRPGWFLRSAWDAAQRVSLANSAEICLLQRELISTLLTFEPMLRRPVVLDIDDAIFLHPRGARFDRWVAQASMVICGNSFIADHYASRAIVHVLATPVDTQRFKPGILPSAHEQILGWSGSSSGLPYLYSIEPALRSVMEARPRCRLRVVCDVPPRFSTLDPSRVEFVRWTEDTEVTSLQTFTLGLMPLEDSPWTRGKCSFKMLTYMATGIPVVVSPVGMNLEVLAHDQVGLPARDNDEWAQAIVALLDDSGWCGMLGRAGRAVVEQYYSVEALVPQLSNHLHEAVR